MKARTRAFTFALVLVLALALAPGSAAAQKWPAPTAAVIDPPNVVFNGFADRKSITIEVEQVYSLFAADFTLTFDSSVIRVIDWTSGSAWDHADTSGAPQVQLSADTLTYINTRFGSSLDMQERVELATITFESVVSEAFIQPFGLTVNVAEKSGIIHAVPVPVVATYEVIRASGVRGQALWPRPVTDHSYIPVQVTDKAGNEIGLNMTDVNGFYPDPGFPGYAPFPIMPEGGQLRINPMVGAHDGGLPFGRIPALETRLTDCEYNANLSASAVRLVGGDVAPIHPHITGDNKIDILDLVLSASRFGAAPTDANFDGWFDGDANRDGAVDILDIVIIANNFGMEGPICEPCPPACDLCQ
ncbi:MAG: hypothetical protein JXA09_04285 [Anaerolineae bacterium]|nr:hypothetical protein [Anaerolineae bacterium]